MSDVRTPELVINKLTKQQYENIQNPSDTEMYLVPEDEEHKPICYPTTASEVTATSMLVKSSVSDNGKILTENGFVYNTSGNPTISDTKVICDLGVGQFEKKLENLTHNTEYHIKSYGQNASGLVYGSELVQSTTYSPIPDEYQLVEYLESTGTQYIDTGVIPLFLYTIESEIAITTNQPLNTFGCMGCNESTLRCFFGYNSNPRGLIIGNSANTWSYLSHPFDYNFHTYKLTPNIVEIDAISDTNVNSYPTSTSIYIFALKTTSSISYMCYAKMSKFKITNYDDTKIREMYPVYRKADNKPGMYDIVNNVFYTNQGTGEFIVGHDKEWDE